MSKKKIQKTNAIRWLDRENIEYEVIEYDTSDGKIDGISVAQKTGQRLEEVYKTLVIQGHSKEYYVCIIPVSSHLDLKHAANFLGEKKVEMIPSKELLPLTGYIHGGCSPIGMKREFKKVIDASAKNIDKICISGGKVGLQVRLSRQKLVNALAIVYGDIAKNRSGYDI